MLRVSPKTHDGRDRKRIGGTFTDDALLSYCTKGFHNEKDRRQRILKVLDHVPRQSLAVVT
jgi:hypothetical protein